MLVVPPLGEAPFHGWVEVDGQQDRGGRPRATRRRRHGQSVIEGKGAALIPGFVNTHAHSHSSLTRGSAEGLPLEGWLTVIEREQAQLSDEQAYVGALATYAEALLSGTTTHRRHVHPAGAGAQGGARHRHPRDDRAVRRRHQAVRAEPGTQCAHA